MSAKTKCIQCGKSDIVDQFVNSSRYDAFECMRCRIAWRVMPDGEVQVITGYSGQGVEDFILVKGVLVVGDSEPIE